MANCYNYMKQILLITSKLIHDLMFYKEGYYILVEIALDLD